MVKEIVGLTVGERLSISWALYKLSLKVFFGSKTQKSLGESIRRCKLLVGLMMYGMAPHPELLKGIVNTMPFRPFGIDNLTDTTKIDGDLAERYKENEVQ